MWRIPGLSFLPPALPVVVPVPVPAPAPVTASATALIFVPIPVPLPVPDPVLFSFLNSFPSPFAPFRPSDLALLSVRCACTGIGPSGRSCCRVRNESACCETKENRRRRRATSVPYARYRDSSKRISDLFYSPDGELRNEDMHVWASLTTRRLSERKGGRKEGRRFYLFVCISLTADGPQRARLSIPPTTAKLPSCLWLRRLFPSLPGSRLSNFYGDASSVLLQLVNQWLNFTYSRSHALRYGSQNINSGFHKNRK